MFMTNQEAVDDRTMRIEVREAAQLCNTAFRHSSPYVLLLRRIRNATEICHVLIPRSMVVRSLLPLYLRGRTVRSVARTHLPAAACREATW
jgi:hypothetical protein